MSAAGKLGSWLKERKDSSVSFVVEKLLQKRLEPYGRLLDFALDSRHQSASLKILLKGEVEPVSVAIDQYILTSEGTAIYLTVKLASASRPWISQLIDDFLIGRRFPLPEKYNSAIRMLL